MLLFLLGVSISLNIALFLYGHGLEEYKTKLEKEYYKEKYIE